MLAAFYEFYIRIYQPNTFHLSNENNKEILSYETVDKMYANTLGDAEVAPYDAAVAPESSPAVVNSVDVNAAPAYMKLENSFI